MVDVGYGDVRSGVDISLGPVPAVGVSGTVAGPPEGWSDLTLRLMPEGAEGAGMGHEAATTVVDDHGRFAFIGVPAGAYVIAGGRSVGAYRTSNDNLGGVGQEFRQMNMRTLASERGAGSKSINVNDTAGTQLSTTYWSNRGEGAPPDVWAREPVAVGDRDIAGLVVTLHPSGVMRGTIVEDLDPARRTPNLDPHANLRLDPADGSPWLGMPETSWRPGETTPDFAIGGLKAGKSFIRVGNGWVVKSVMWNGRQYADAPFDAADTQDFESVQVVVTNAGASVSGVVRNEHGAPLEDAVVLVFPAEAAQWTGVGAWPPRLRWSTTANDGGFAMTDLPAGDYDVVALVPAAAEPPRPDADLLRAAQAFATPVTLLLGRDGTPRSGGARGAETMTRRLLVVIWCAVPLTLMARQLGTTGRGAVQPRRHRRPGRDRGRRAAAVVPSDRDRDRRRHRRAPRGHQR